MFLGVGSDPLDAYTSSLLLIPDPVPVPCTDAHMEVGGVRSEQSIAFNDAKTEECVVPLSRGHCLLLLLLLLSLLLNDLCSLLRSVELVLPVLGGVERAGLFSQN